MRRVQIFILFFILIPFGAFSQGYFTLSGIVTDGLNGKLLDGIDIVVQEKATGTITNYKGAYILYLDRGAYEVSFSANGYKQAKLKVDLSNDFVQMVELTPKKQANTVKLFKKIKLMHSRKNPDILSDNTK